jgi:hypothetical protein
MIDENSVLHDESRLKFIFDRFGCETALRLLLGQFRRELSEIEELLDATPPPPKPQPPLKIQSMSDFLNEDLGNE